jgi:HEAT repeat protein
VYEALKTANTDQSRERLSHLRYRLVASDGLVLRWPGGVKRLASSDVATRHKAATELAEVAHADDEPLLLELFSDPDALVRELSLQALRSLVGDEPSAALARLLDDPEPNVRAAVLKQLTENPAPSLMPHVAKYVLKEQDSDLIVHAIRFLKEVKTSAATNTLIKLLDHES